MTGVKKIKYSNELEDFREVLERTRYCDCAATLKQLVPNTNGGYNQLDQQTVIVEKVRLIANVDEQNDMFTVLIQSKNPELKRIGFLWDTVLARGTTNFLKGTPNDYVLVFDMYRSALESNTAYVLSALSPVFISREDEGLRFAFLMDNVYFEKSFITMDEIEYEASLLPTEYEDEEREDFNNNDDILGGGLLGM